MSQKWSKLRFALPVSQFSRQASYTDSPCIRESDTSLSLRLDYCSSEYAHRSALNPYSLTRSLAYQSEYPLI